jgi:hypothetical protein
MNKYTLNVEETCMYSVDVEAETPEEAEEMLFNGLVDYSHNNNLVDTHTTCSNVQETK